VTKKEIVKQISERIGLTQLKTKEIVQQTFDAIVATLINERSHRIELRNFGVFEVKLRKPRKARNPRTGEKVDVPAKAVVTFKPGKEMEERVREIPSEELEAVRPDEEEGEGEEAMVAEGNGVEEHAAEPAKKVRKSL
jgi:nucleoid DNA-binding protein